MSGIQDLMEKRAGKVLEHQPPLENPETPPATKIVDAPVDTKVLKTDPPPPAVVEKPELITPDKFLGEEYKERSWDDIKGEFQTSKQEAARFKQELEAANSRQPEYADQEVAEFDAWIKNGGVKDYSTFLKVKGASDGISDIDAIIAKEVLANPEYKGLEDILKSNLSKELPLEGTEEEPLDENTIKLNKAKLAQKANEARAFLKEQQSKLRVKEITKVNPEEVMATRKQAWTPATDKLLSGLKNIPIPIIKNENGKNVEVPFIEFQVMDEVKANYRDAIIDFASKNSDLTEDALKNVGSQILNKVIVDNLPQIVTQAVAKKEAELIEFYDKKYGGGFTPKSPGAASSTASSTKEVREKLMSL